MKCKKMVKNIRKNVPQPKVMYSNFFCVNHLIFGNLNQMKQKKTTLKRFVLSGQENHICDQLN